MPHAGEEDGDLLCVMEGGRREDMADVFCMHSCN